MASGVLIISHLVENQAFFSNYYLKNAGLYLVHSAVEKRPREVKSLLRANGPIPTHIQPIYKNNTFFPTLRARGEFTGFITWWLSHTITSTKEIIHEARKFPFTHWQPDECVTGIAVHKQSPHEKTREAGSFGERFPRGLIKTEIGHLRQTRVHKTENRMAWFRDNKAYKPVNKAGFHFQAVHCKIS